MVPFLLGDSLTTLKSQSTKSLLKLGHLTLLPAGEQSQDSYQVCSAALDPYVNSLSTVHCGKEYYGSFNPTILFCVPGIVQRARDAKMSGTRHPPLWR